MAKKKKKAYQFGGESRASEKRAQSSSKTYQKSSPSSQKPVAKGPGTLRLEKKRMGGSKKSC